MASTYSITLSAKNTGYRAHNAFLPANEQIEDAFVPPGALTGAMSDNTQVQVKRPDGSLKYYTLDASRSDPSKNLIFLLPA
jgi:hypothetical protein